MPVTVAEQVAVWSVVIVVGKTVTLTEVMVTGTAVTVTLAKPDLVVSSVDVAVIFADPMAEGVNTPAELIVPPVAVHVTA